MTRPGAHEPSVLVRRASVDTDVAALAELLRDAVAGGASIGFLAGLTREEARAWASEHLSRDGVVVLLATDGNAAALGTVALDLVDKPNGRHRAEVAKLMVARRSRRLGVARRLMSELEAVAVREGRTLLILDTETGSPAQRLYEDLGYEVVGTVAGYAASPDGTLAPTTFMAKHLG